ncbi:MAG: hypothetical protein KAW12_04620 [Candidatus Aminicenantes bacterium]|nr:hypothetical protein [Candidatus Aminicenantes bacterium]
MRNKIKIFGWEKISVLLLIILGTYHVFPISYDNKTKADDLFKEAKKFYYWKKYKEAEKKTMEALALVPWDAEQYQPNRLLGKIRMEIPPQPKATADINLKESSAEIIVTIENSGQSSMEEVMVFILTTDKSFKVKTISRIKPGGKKTLKWIVSNNLVFHSLEIYFKEKYGFIPCPLIF